MALHPTKLAHPLSSSQDTGPSLVSGSQGRSSTTDLELERKTLAAVKSEGWEMPPDSHSWSSASAFPRHVPKLPA